MPITLISSESAKKENTTEKKKDILHISEFFSHTIQGEGVSIGHPATFLRLQGCVLNCTWCDTTEVWQKGNSYTFSEIFSLMEKYNTITLLKNNQHLVITGGSPLKQQEQLILFLSAFKKNYGFIPFTEIENECVLPINPLLLPFISQWNNSPKLSNSTMKKKARYKPEVLLQMKAINNAWFKFVIEKEEEWQEIETDFLTPQLIHKKQIILMPMAASKKHLNKLRKQVLTIAIKHNVKFSDRLHITIFDKKTSV